MAVMTLLLPLAAGCTDGSQQAEETTVAPVDTTAAPVETTAAPIDTTAAPVDTTAAPIDTTAAPIDTTAAPVDTTAAPVDTTAAPVDTTAAPVDTTAAPVDTTAAPVDTTAAPVETTAAPVDTTAAPVETTAAPVDTTAAPVETTAAPVEMTSAPEQTSSSGTEPDQPYTLSGDTSAFSYTSERVCSDYGSSVLNSSAYSAFFASTSDSGITIPALAQNFVPQGIDYWDEAGVFLISGYFNPASSSSSVLLAVEKDTGKYVGEWSLKNTDGSAHTAHDGGVAVTEKDIYLSNGSKLFRISLDQLKKTGNHGTLKIEQAISVPVKASYCNYSGGYLWVGEFSLQGNASYTITGHEYAGNYAWTAGYRLGADGRPESSPAVIISTPERIQGFCMFDDGRIFMTRSYGRTNDSYFYITKTALLSSDPDASVTVGGKNVPLYLVAPEENCTSVRGVPMAEGCTALGGKAYVIYESGAYYYRAASSSVSKNPTDRIWIFEK
jgi:hypothetical protein